MSMKSALMLRTALLAAPGLAAAQPVTGPYISLGGGVNLQQNETVIPAPSLGYQNKVIYTFHPGFAGKASIGYGLGSGLRAEFEGDYLSNVVRGAQGFTPEGTNPPRRAGGLERKYGGFVNVLYDVDLGLPVSPYIGIGAGGLAIEHRGFNQSVQGVMPPIFNGPALVVDLPPGTKLGFHDQTVGGFAYQAIAGFSYALPFISGLSFTTEYHFVGLLDPLPAYQLTQRRVGFVQATPLTSPYYRAYAVTGNRKFGNDLNHEIILGFRYALFQPPAPLPPAAPPPQAAPAPIPSARTYLVFFDWDRADLTARARQIVAQAAQAAQQPGTTRIDVNGYTDLSGTPAYNQRLSVRRAQTVQAELVRDGVSQSAIAIHGYGETSPLVQTAKGVREPQNRRVEIIFH